MNDTALKPIITDGSVNDLPSPKQSRGRESWNLFRQNQMAVAGMIIFIVFLLVALSGLVFTSGQNPTFDPSQIRLQEKLRPPLSTPQPETVQSNESPAFGRFILGTDNLGRDVFSRMLQGAWVSLTVGFVAVGISVGIGIFMGGIAGYFGQQPIRFGHILAIICLALGLSSIGFHHIIAGIIVLGIFLLIMFSLYKYSWSSRKKRPVWVRILRADTISWDALIMRIVDIMLCFPTFFLILTVVALLPGSIYNIMVVIGLTSWMGTTRFVRAEFLSLREQDFVTAAKALGIHDFRIIFRHMIPNAIAPVLVSATIGIASAILTEAGLSFLGFGVPPPHATWGNILSDGKGFIFDAPWLTFVPGIAILIVVLSFNLFGEGLRDALNPKLRNR